MTIAKRMSLTPSAMIDAARTYFRAPDVQPLPARRLPAPEPKIDSLDRARYARLLENELDRQLYSEVEREDSDMLNRVRAALYAE